MSKGIPFYRCPRCQAPTTIGCFCPQLPTPSRAAPPRAVPAHPERVNGAKRPREAVESSSSDECDGDERAATDILGLPIDLEKITRAAQRETATPSYALPPLPSQADAPPLSNAVPTSSAGDDAFEKYHLWQYSSFSPELLDPHEKRSREKRDAKYRRAAASLEVDVVSPVRLDVRMASKPKSTRAGLAGTRLDMSMVTRPRGRPRKAGTKAQSTPSPSSNVEAPPTPSPRDKTTPSSTNSRFPSSSQSPPSPPSPSSEDFRRQRVEAALIAETPSLAGYTFSHRTGIPGKTTSYVDRTRRSFGTRIECPMSLSTLAADLGRDVAHAVLKGHGGISAMPTDGSRGGHEVRQIGVHREQGCKEGYSHAFKTAPVKWTSMMSGLGFKRARGHVSRCLEVNYPKLFEYHRNLAATLAAVSLYFLFGAFASFCLNTGGRVACLRHRDGHNLGPGLCGILPWGDFDSSRSAWLILDEARLVVQVGAGDVFFFPSAIFHHWNTPVHPDDARNSLAFWSGASLFLWAECGGRAFNTLEEEERKEIYRTSGESWVKAWDRFPIL